MGEPVGFIKDLDAWNELIEWAIARNFDNYATAPDTVPFRVMNILKKDGGLSEFTAGDFFFALGVLKAHYEIKAAKAAQTEMKLGAA